jgi:formylglycine-generating enzyme
VVKHRYVSALALTLVWSAACSQLVGITDTEVTNNAAAGSGASSATAGDTSAKAGASNNGGAAANAGAAQGGHAGAMNASGATSGGANGGAGGSSGGAAIAGDGGEGGASGCADDAERCVTTGHERCMAGAWQADPCTPDEPTCAGNICTVRGPTMANVGTYFIDSTEVTVGQYKKFLTAKAGDTGGQPTVCAWNTSFYAAGGPLELDNMPIANVDWCDATAFCSWADKRLCGAIAGGSIPRADFFDQTKSQWYRACAGPGGASHPSDAFEPCNSKNGNGPVAPVATFPNCEGRTPGVFDLEGNVTEWVDTCDGATGASDNCSMAGGNVIDAKSYCSEANEFPRDDASAYFGFRCCSK